MSFNLDDANVGGQLKVGTGIVPAIGEGDRKINGSAFAEGPVVFGAPTQFPTAYASLNLVLAYYMELQYLNYLLK
jgi:hypothetical protein